MANSKLFALLILALTLQQAHARSQSQRTLTQAVDGLVDGLLEDDIANNTVYQEVSSSTGDLSNPSAASGWLVVALNASLELSTNASYAYNYLSANGTTRFNATIQLAKAANAANAANNPPAITASVQTVSCSANPASNFLLDTSNQPLSQLQLVPASNSITSAQAGRNITNNIVYNTLVDYDSAKSVGVYASGSLIACRNLAPPFPDFPNDWSATIEITDSVNGTTYIQREMYSQSQNKIRLDVHSFGEDRILLTDTSTSSMTVITPSNGTCQQRYTRRTNWITGKDNVTLLSTAQVLHFSDNQFSYIPGNYSVRGIQCELWQAPVNISTNWFNATFTASFYFPVNQWLVNREDYHRMLKQTVLNGTANGRQFLTYISYVNFRPRTFYAPLFEVCAISPYGSGCNCTDKLRQAAFANISQIESDGDDISVVGDEKAACKYGGSVPHGFISAQSGPYVGLTIIGMIGGALITAVAMHFIYKKRTGVVITDNFSHQKFTDAPGS